MKKFFICFFAATLLFGSAVADEIVVGADNWPPFNSEPGSEKPGYMIEIARKVFAEKGHTLVYQTIPWARAINLAREGKINGIVGAAVGDAEDFVFPKNELGQLESFAFVRKDSTWKYAGAESLKDVKIGLILDYDYGSDIMAYVDGNKGSKKIDLVGGDDPLKKNILKLKANRVDVVIEVKPVFEHTANEMGLADLFKSAGSDGIIDPIYIAFSPKNPKSQEYAQILSDGIAQLRQSGELAKIIAKYGQKDWK